MSSSSTPCAACKFLRRKCTQECVFSPYFPPNEPQKFANIHKVFGASNVTKILNELEPRSRKDAVISLIYEAESRLSDPIYGCVGLISVLQQKLRRIRDEIIHTRQVLAGFIGESVFLPIPENPSSYNMLPQHHSNNASSSFTVPYAGPSYGGGQLPIHELQKQMAEEFMRQQQEHLFVGLVNSGFDLSGPVSGGRGFEPVTVAAPMQLLEGLSSFDNSFNRQIEQPQELHNSEIQHLLLLQTQQQQPRSPAPSTPSPEQQLFRFESDKDEGRGGVGPSC